MDFGAADGQDLARRVGTGDPQAWEELYLYLYPRLKGFAMRRVGPQSASDVVAETMARAVSSIDRFDPVGMGLSAWIFGICRHVVADSLRSAARADRLGKGPGWAAHALAEAVPIDAIVDRLEHEEEAVALRLAYANLSEEDRELLDLRVIAGLSAEEVGVLLDRNAGAVRMAQSRALARLRTQFKLVYR